jgi:CDP-diacylglycerol--glycerol-3-phosphate 3-phosphatidyltransferase
MTDIAAAKPSNLPNILTFGRLLAAPLVGALILWADHTVFSAGAALAGQIYAAALAVFLIAALTDLADGALARKLGAVTPLGAALDHAADKALTACALLALTAAILPRDLAFAALLIVGRDMIMAGLREGLAQAGRKLPVGQLGKLKTVVELVAITMILAIQVMAMLNLAPELLEAAGWAARIALWAAAILGLLSLGLYLREAMRQDAAV